MRVTVTGGGGFLGTALLAHLRRRHPDAQLAATVRSAPEHPVDGVDYASDPPPADVVFHLAGSRGIAASLDDPVGDLRANVESTIAVLVGAGAATVVLASSSAVYGNAPPPAHESGPVAPRSPYGVSKLAAELYAQMHHRASGRDVRIARIGNPYGPGQRRHVVYDLASRALREGRVRIRGTGREVRDFIHADDTAAALALIAEQGEPGATYNVASGEATTILDLAGLIAVAAGVPGEVEADGTAAPGKVDAFLPSIERLRGLGFAPARGLREGIEETVAWIAEAG